MPKVNGRGSTLVKILRHGESAQSLRPTGSADRGRQIGVRRRVPRHGAADARQDVLKYQR